MESSVVSSSHLPLVSEPIEPPLIIFTVLGPLRADGTRQNAFSAAIIAELQQFKARQYENPDHKSVEQVFAEKACEAVVFTEEASLEGIDFRRAVALFDGEISRGSFSRRHVRRFLASRYSVPPSWATDAKWLVLVHRHKGEYKPNPPARQLAVMYVTKFEEFLKKGLLPQKPPPRKPRPKRKARVRGAERSQYFIS